MVSNNRRCSECQGEMLLDHIKEKDGVTTFYYTCINPTCKEKGKAYSASGTDTESQIRDKE